jgi:hypothetical protein
MRACNKLLLVAFAASLLATPSFARTIHTDAVPAVDASWADASVYRSDGKYLGADPDARVRFELYRDSHASDN